MHRRQVCIWFDNLRRYRSGADPHSPDLTLNCTAVAVLHTTALPAYRGLPELAEIEARVPKVADDIFRSHRALFDRIDVANQGIQRVWVRAPLHIARKNVRSLNWRPFFLSKLRSGTHKELLQLVVDLSCVEHRTRHCVPLLVDMKIHFALLKLCYGAAYVPWNVPQLLLGFPLVYGVWHSYKYCVELIYRAFLPFIKFLEQGNSLQVGSILPRKVKVIHMEKTLLGLMLATSSNRGRLDERVTALLSSQRDLTPIQRKGLRMLLALKALLYTYCPAAFSIGTLVRECNWEGRGAGSGIVAKQALEMSLPLMLNILKPEEQLATLSVYFASMMSTRFSKDCNVVCALLGEETVVPEEFVQSIRAAITNADTCPPKSWEDVYHDLGAGFPVYCSGVRYVDEDPEEQDGEAESQQETHTPKKKPKTAPAPSPSGTQCAQATPASSLGTVAPTIPFTIPGWKHTVTELCHCQAWCCSHCQASC